jgi:PAS domain S-box-containing protein
MERSPSDNSGSGAESRLLGHFLNALGDPVFVKDEHHRYVFLNDRCCEFVGLPRAELIGRSDYDVFPKEQADVFWDRDDFVLATGQLDVNEEKIATSGGERIISTAKSLFVDPSSSRRYIVGVIRDVTERKRLERLVLQIGDAERRRVGQDLHDEVGQRLTGVALLLQAFIDRLEIRDDPEPARRILGVVREAIGSVRQVSRSLAPIGGEESDLHGALEELIAQSESRLRLPVELRCGRPFAIDQPATVAQLYRITQEALTNVAKHARATRAAVGVERRGHECVLDIEDDGVGIDDEGVQGKGLGLSIMRYRASMIGGSLTVKRREEGGTRVRCTFTP